MQAPDVEAIEVNLLLEALYQRYGYDFRSYARASVHRRLRQFLITSEHDRLADLIPHALHDVDFFSALTQALSVSTTEMFRDPVVYRALREQVLPVLKTWPHFKVWHAGCSTGEEVYSLAILLHESELLRRATLYATDFNDRTLATAKGGIYRLDAVRAFTRSYQQAGGLRSFSDYYHARYDSAVMQAFLRNQITFANHNLTVDQSFGEMHLVMCRNVLIYFDRELQNRVLRVFADSLVYGGFLCLGLKESLQFSALADEFEEVDARAKIYKKIRPG